MRTRRSWLVGGTLAVIWAVLIIWQVAGHLQARRTFENMVVDRGRSISSTCGLLMRTRGFFGVISRERLEAALNGLVDTNELRSVELLNTNGEVVAAAGAPFELPPRYEMEGGVLWGNDTVTVENPVDLGTNVPQIVLPLQELRSMETNHASNAIPPVPPSTNSITSTNGPRHRDWGRRQGRPYWMTEAEYRGLLEKKGAHTFVIVMSAEPVRHATLSDLWMRAIIAILGTVAVAGYAMAWRTLEKSSELQLRLMRASELNLHLKELNLAAAGLAHETRNPLNIIRGLAQLISKHEQIAPEIQAKSREIISESDRLTAQLNEFINYSRPREVRRSAIDLNAITAEVVRTLNFDLEEKGVQLQLQVETLVIEADEQLLRQVLFNLVLNAIQAVPEGGTIRIRGSRRNHEEAFLEISDTGPGVPPENRSEIFKPYFTTHQEGTGLGLAIVHQIVLAHGWEIACLPQEPNGALFHISHLKIKS